MGNVLLTDEEVMRLLRRTADRVFAEFGWFNEMFIEWQYPWERKEFDEHG